MNTATKDLLYKMADDAFIIGHRNSEWTGIGPMLEEDLAFSSMAQDKIGHAWALYKILNEQFGEADADVLGFQRKANDFKCCQFVELPIGEYDFSLVRHFLFDHAEYLRYEALSESSFEPLALLAKKIKSEIKYHTMHADTLLRQLANGSEEAKARIQNALNYSWHFALGIFEESSAENELISNKVFIGEDALKSQWIEKVSSIIDAAGLKVPVTENTKIILGGRKGTHSEYLQPLLTEMTEVLASDPNAEW
ncbi:MAG: phenylacetate-CoA oxygenase subunit PaaI [Bacteroidetes bacterium 37-13]|nr:MAG: phenylacetate-CoA oxygenase subunit PaaI [Bacteroidetes bacterium 37-13]